MSAYFRFMRGEDTWRCPPDGWLVLGLMSGTSVDGLDVAMTRVQAIHKGGHACSPESYQWDVKLEAFTTLDYPSELRSSLWGAMELPAEELAALDWHWSRWSGQAVLRWLSEGGHPRPHLISSHGHTVFHRPEQGWTLQLGCGATLHAVLEAPVVHDLRRLDVALGGQGAPLVPLADKLLFGTWDAALNLGGFANVSLDDANGQRVAWDVGPANLLLNHLVKPLGLDMDRDGALAAEGRVDANLLKSWQSLSYHEMAPPKSLGREWLEKEVIPVLASYAHLPVQDVLATAVAYIADMVVQELPAGMGVLVTGGGAFNGALMEALRQKGKDKHLSWHLPDPSMIHGKEAYVFAWLGLLRWLGMTNTMQSVTGAQSASAGGALWGPGPHEVDRSA